MDRFGLAKELESNIITEIGKGNGEASFGDSTY